MISCASVTATVLNAAVGSSVLGTARTVVRHGRVVVEVEAAYISNTTYMDAESVEEMRGVGVLGLS